MKNICEKYERIAIIMHSSVVGIGDWLDGWVGLMDTIDGWRAWKGWMETMDGSDV